MSWKELKTEPLSDHIWGSPSSTQGVLAGSVAELKQPIDIEDSVCVTVTMTTCLGIKSWKEIKRICCCIDKPQY